MAVHTVRLHERHRGRDGAEQLVGDGLRLGWRRGRRSRRRVAGLVAVAGELQQADQPGMRCDDVARAALEQLAPLARDRFGILEVVLEEVAREARVQSVDVHYILFSKAGSQPSARAPEMRLRLAGDKEYESLPRLRTKRVPSLYRHVEGPRSTRNSGERPELGKHHAPRELPANDPPLQRLNTSPRCEPR